MSNEGCISGGSRVEDFLARLTFLLGQALNIRFPVGPRTQEKSATKRNKRDPMHIWMKEDWTKVGGERDQESFGSIWDSEVT